MKFFLALLLVILIVVAAAGAWLWVSLLQPYKDFPAEGVFVTVPRGASCRTVAGILEKDGVVRSALAFKLYCRRHPKRGLQAGEYFFDRELTGRDVFWLLANGKIYEKQFTVREGETMFDIARELEAANFMSAADFLKAAADPAPVLSIAPQAASLEGFLYPATYHFPRHPAPADVIASMTGRFKEIWARIAPSAVAGPDDDDEPGSHSGLSLVTLASLVERETPLPDERRLVAGVFENRLRRRMLLQCDPTVIYALEREGKYRGSLTLSDLRVDSPYNTYRHQGLPPGPIGNPGEVSLRAAVAPAVTDYLYFVANARGGHFFSATLAEHNRNVQRYRRLLAGLPADPEPAPPAAPKRHPRRKTKAKNASLESAR
ncbi:MAG TPA: endolytic transglycosylase MltG [Methylomirabilota bacterium]|nr:endolytic transglycosylase MltG [Methylomirabilota bacterium]